MAGTTIKADGLSELIDGLGQARKALGKESRRANQEVSKKVAGWARQNAASGSRQERRFAGAIKPAATQKKARIAVRATGRNRGANVPFFGMDRRTGWYGASKYGSSSRRQSPPWVGNRFQVGSGDGPRAIDPAIRDHRAEIDRMVLDAPMRALARAFPKGS